MLSVLFIALGVIAASATPIPYKNCSSSGLVQVTTLDATPWPPHKGKPITVVADVTLMEEITADATYEVAVKVFGVKVYSVKGKLGDANPGASFPIPAGEIKKTVTVTVPSEIPSAKLEIEVSANDAAGNQLGCGISSVTVEATQKLLSMTPVHDLVDVVNSMGSTWKAGVNERFIGATLGDVAQLCGTFLGEEEVRLPSKKIEVASDLPTEFDARTGFPECADVIGHIGDQSDCGSCWAFGSTKAFNDRLCIATNGTFQTLLSPSDVTSCCGAFKCMSFGCNGGQPGMAWRYFVHSGVVSGGNHDATDTCYPYFLPTCSHHVDTPGVPKCTGEVVSAPSCPSSCANQDYATLWSKDKHFAKSSYSIDGEKQIMSEIMRYGSVTAAFTVYADFPTYKTGVYKHVSGAELGGHAIKIQGWGVEAGEPYWLVSNSWNPTWGDKGYFRIARGNDECGIESSVSAGHAL